MKFKRKFVEFFIDKYLRISVPLIDNRINMRFTDKPTWSIFEQCLWDWRDSHIKKFIKKNRTGFYCNKVKYRFVINDENGIHYSKWGLFTK